MIFLTENCPPKVSQRPGRLLAARRVDRMDRSSPVAMSDPLGKSHRHRQEHTGCRIPMDALLKSGIYRWIDHLWLGFILIYAHLFHLDLFRLSWPAKLETIPKVNWYQLIWWSRISFQPASRCAAPCCSAVPVACPRAATMRRTWRSRHRPAYPAWHRHGRCIHLGRASEMGDQDGWSAASCDTNIYQPIIPYYSLFMSF